MKMYRRKSPQWRAKVLVFLGLGLGFLLALETQADPPAAPEKVTIRSTAVKPVDTAPGEGIALKVTDTLNKPLDARLELQKTKNDPKPVRIEAPKGVATAPVPPGDYKAYIYAYFEQVPVLVDVYDISIKAGSTTLLNINVVEGSGSRSIFAFDKDCDFALDRVELACGTKPDDATDVPGRATLPLDSRVYSKEKKWFRGELHAYSTYGGGKETVAQLIARAEKLNLDFLAITDRNTMAAAQDPAFHSNSVVLIPALEWGDDKKGVALVYGPRTFPEYVDSIPQAQAMVDQVQAQGGFIAAAHPCFPNNPWEWGLGFLNGVEVWCRDWNGTPPMTLDALDKFWLRREKKKLVYSIAFAAATKGIGANEQSTKFYDAELLTGAKMCVIGGSSSRAPEVPIGQPITYVYGLEKSARGIIDGLRRGRTYVSKGLDGPKIMFQTQVLKKDVLPIGGLFPIGATAKFSATVQHAKGMDLEVLLNGVTFIRRTVEGEEFTIQFEHTPDTYSTYRVRVINPHPAKGIGPVEVLATSSPIYADRLEIKNGEMEKLRKKRLKQQMDAPEIKNLPDASQNTITPQFQE